MGVCFNSVTHNMIIHWSGKAFLNIEENPEIRKFDKFDYIKMKNFFDKTPFLKNSLKMRNWAQSICIIWDEVLVSFTLSIRKTYTPREKWVQDKQFTINEMHMVNKQKKKKLFSLIYKKKLFSLIYN